MEKISVIISTYNRIALLRKAIDSVLGQSYNNFEIIVVDDGSTDDTRAMLNKYYKDKVKYIYQENKGPSGARNQGIKEAECDFIAFLDSDDWWDKDKLKIQLKAMEENPNYLISHTQEIWYKDGKFFNQKNKHRKFSGFIFDKCLPICAVSMSTAMVKKELFKAVGYFDENMPCCEDYDFWLRVSAKFPFLLIDKPLTLKDGGRTDQVSSIYARGMDKFRINSIKKLIEEDSLNLAQRQLAIKELQKKCKIYGEGCIKHGRQEEGKYYLSFIEEINNS